MKRYGYHRTSSKEQHLDRGITEINNYCNANNLELEKKEKRQKEGIQAKKERGEWNDYGRPAVISLDEFAKEYNKVATGILRPFKLMKQLGMSKATYYRYVS